MLFRIATVLLESRTYWIGGTSRMQCPKVPNVTLEWRMSVLFVSMTLRMERSPTTGAEIVVTRRRMAAMRREITPTLVRC
jgi:hypothetical protein